MTMIEISIETKEKVRKHLKEYKYTCSVVWGGDTFVPVVTNGNAIEHSTIYYSPVTNLSVIINFT